MFEPFKTHTVQFRFKPDADMKKLDRAMQLLYEGCDTVEPSTKPGAIFEFVLGGKHECDECGREAENCTMLVKPEPDELGRFETLIRCADCSTS